MACVIGGVSKVRLQGLGFSIRRVFTDDLASGTWSFHRSGLRVNQL
jgi:hypothetical protein